MPDMSDVTTRLRAYRPVLDAAIEERVRAGTQSPSYVDTTNHQRRRMRRMVPIAVVGAAAVILSVLAVIGGGSQDAARTIRPAAPPDGGRLLMALDGWQVTRADEQDSG